MPCYDPRDDVPVVYENGVPPDEHEKALAKVSKLEAVLCAVFNELDRKNILEETVSEASRNGLVNVMSFYQKHKADDIAKLISDLHRRYSKDELEIVKHLLNSGKI